MKVVVVGGSASGIIAALKASVNHEVILLEKNDKLAKKILLTGNGKCNLWNEALFENDIDLKDYYYTDNYNLLNKLFYKKDKVFNYLKDDLGIYIKNKNGYIYPYSESAYSIRSILEKSVTNNKNIKVITNFEVKKIIKEDKFKVIGNEEIIADIVIIAAGGLASKLGTNSINNLLDGIKINECLPSLVPIKASNSFLKNISGIRTNAKLSLYHDNNLIKEEIGELQFTDYGISGIVTLNLSGYVSRLKNVKITIDLMPELNYIELKDIILNFDKEKTIEESLESFFNYKLLFELLNLVKIDKNKKGLTDNEIDDLIKIIKELSLNITGTLDFDRAQVMTGGVSLMEVNENLELNKIKNLYVVGEALDIDGICGGFNLASAFITGYIAGEVC